MRTVALLDHHSAGHHYAFARLFAKYLLKLGYRVCIFFPEKEKELKEYFHGTDPNQILFYPFIYTQKKYKNFGRFNDALAALSLWGSSANVLRKAEKEFKIRFDFVFFSWLDDYLANYLPYQAVDFVFKKKWSGLYFHPWYLYSENINTRVSISSLDNVLMSKRCQSVGVHDELLAGKLKGRILKKVVFFPEISDATPPSPNDILSINIKHLAKGRIIVGLIGLAKRKGVLQIMELAKRANPSSYFFFLSGKLNEPEYTRDEFEILTDFITYPQENVYYHPDSINEGASINSVINALDIIFLIYQNFKSSSNFNTKAAHFNKVVLASNQYWIGRITKEYSMGVTVDENDVNQAQVALEDLSSRIRTGNCDFSKYKDYLSVHAEENLEFSFRESFSI